MHLFYIDESGNTGNNAADQTQPHHLLAALAVDAVRVRTIEADVKALGFKHFGKAASNTDFEFHGYDIHSGRGAYFKHMKVAQRIQIMDELLELVVQHNIPIFYAEIDKQKAPKKYHPHQLAFLFLVERIEDYLRGLETSSAFSGDSLGIEALGLLVADENEDIEQRLIDDLDYFKTVDTGFGWRPTQAKHIIDSIHFVRSNNNELIQLADVVTYIISRGRKVHRDILAAMEVSANGVSQQEMGEWIETNGSQVQKVNMRQFEVIRPLIKSSKTFP